ncbi:hypothetical protein DF107_02640 [Burkholderia stagnalis]|uniref:plasmid replication protein, CyRepA1 family n=1 Tax=Burkholderia stagnalis TaxID=1503054 RepID=UPI000F5AC940|nr:plasmid replication protein, CyRepA1 family [Burkholderia stagnalis]RQQ21303.1 hypothetical protein DF161_00600 [Burkholderia stagnalis]RQY84954.1 hypothetical protein DF107_02640 [Burkholderia stagnalis]
MEDKLKVAVNRHIINKIEDKKSYLWEIVATGFENVELTPEELAEHVNQGHPFCAQHNKRRLERNFSGTNVLAVDIDSGWRLEDALNDPFVKQNALLIYTTPNHTAENHRFRIVFKLTRMISEASDMRAAYIGAARILGGDKACQDACRLFFGSKESNPIVLRNELSDHELEKIIALGRMKRVADHSADKRGVRPTPAVQRFEHALDADQIVVLASGRTIPLADAHAGLSIKCPIHNDHNPSAFVVTNQNGVNGVHCKKCCASFWPPSVQWKKFEKFDFFRAEHIISELQHSEDPSFLNDPERRIEDGESVANVDLQRHFVFSKPRVTDANIEFGDGVIFLRSPKGSGKTYWLEEVVKQCREQAKSVLLIGHRQTLLRTLANRLELTCYFYFDGTGQRSNLPEDYYAICIDSMGRLLKPTTHRYDVVIIDEAEQVISHLTGSTLKTKRRKCFGSFMFYLRNAKSVVVSDADLGPITVETICASVQPEMDYRFYVNRYKESVCPVYSYENESHLVQSMVEAVGAGGRHYIATNSKSRAEVLAEMLQKKFGGGKKVMLVTANTVRKPDVADFVRDIDETILEYDVTIASPTLGTGIDITFKDGTRHIDTVFGFFDARINTHFDMDQQLSRVRNPGEIRLWVTPERFAFETDVNVIRDEVVDSDDMNEAFNGYRSDGTDDVDEHYLRMYANVKSIERASKNRLRENLIELRQHNGWEVIPVASDVDVRKVGRGILDEARAALKARKVEEVCNAVAINYEQYQQFRERSSAGIMLEHEKELAMRRYEIETFYREDISPDLMTLDDNGRYRDKVRLMETYLSPMTHIRERADAEKERGYFASDANMEAAKKFLLMELLNAAGLADDYGDIQLDVAVTQKTLGKFVACCQKRSGKIEELFGINVRGDVEGKAKNQLDDVIDMIGLKFDKAERRKINGEHFYYYRLEQATWNRIKQIIDARMSIDVGFVPTIEVLSDSERALKSKREKVSAMRSKAKGLLQWK